MRSAVNIISAVAERLIGYAVIIERNVRYFGNISSIHAILTPNTPAIVSTAGSVDMPNPRRYPAITS